MKRQEKRDSRRYGQSSAADFDTAIEGEDAGNAWQKFFKLPSLGNREHASCFICSWERTSDSSKSEFYVSV